MEAIIENGELYIEANTLSPLINDDAEITHFISTGRDVTEENEAAETLAIERGRLAITLQGLTDGVIATDENGCVMLMNPAAERLTGLSADEVLCQPAEAILTGAENRPAIAGALHDLLGDKYQTWKRWNSSCLASQAHHSRWP